LAISRHCVVPGSVTQFTHCRSQGMGRGFQPVAIRERIQTLDVVRGFALLGIALMNVEFFNRPLAAIGDGLPAESAGMDAWSGLLIHLLVRGKFYVLFSLLFG